jgi:hypothetical protein
MKKRYRVVFSQRIYYYVDVDAHSADQAIELADPDEVHCKLLERDHEPEVDEVFEVGKFTKSRRAILES